MSFVLISILFFYSFMIFLLWIGQLKLKTFKPARSENLTAFTICIPFRNEADNLPALLDSLSELEYPNSHYEIILINDGSTDSSIKIINDFIKKNHSQIDLLIIDNVRLSGSPKKDALNQAIQNSKYDWIVTTDADCQVPKQWLLLFNTFIVQRSKTFVAAPVAHFDVSGILLNVLQQLDLLSLQGATIGGFGINKPFLCNGANIAFAKADFLRLNGYSGNEEIASGDDVFLMQKFLQDNPKSVGYLKSKNATVWPKPQESWHGLINQRKRWAAKAGSYNNRFSQVVSWTVLLGNLALIGSVFFVGINPLLVYGMIAKVIVDFILIVQTAVFFNKKKPLWGYLGSMLLYPFFVVYVAVLSQLGSFNWKGREFRK